MNEKKRLQQPKNPNMNVFKIPQIDNKMHYDFCFIEIFRHINLDKESHDVENIEIWEKKK